MANDSRQAGNDGGRGPKAAGGVLFDFILREWLLVAAAAGFLLTSIPARRLALGSPAEREILFVLWALFIAVKGLEKSGLMANLSRRLEAGPGAAVKLVAATFLLALLVTNDAALVVIIPLTLGLSLERKGLLVIFEALAANAGSALTPFGNPQNFYLYWFYDLRPLEFLQTMAPFSLSFLLLLLLAAGLLEVGRSHPERTESGLPPVRKRAAVYVFLLAVVLLSVLRLLPPAAGLAVVLFALLFDRPALRVDYGLLLTFFFFFGLADNLKLMLAARLAHPSHVFLLSALASQVISNVPAALIFAKFTANWKALLWGVNTGGFGSLFGSFANLIAYRLYLAGDHSARPARFTLRFLLCGYAAFFLACGLYFLLMGPAAGGRL
jgi:Na+/H+ antiporter NhaD/arsenite permease-like protein